MGSAYPLLCVLPRPPVMHHAHRGQAEEALKPGRRDSADDGELGKLLAASAKKVLLQKLEFEPASKSFSYQLESLKSKYVLLNPRTEGAGCHRSGDEPPARRQGTDAEGGAEGPAVC